AEGEGASVGLEALLPVRARRFATGPVPESAASALPVKVRVAPAALPLVLKSSVPSLVRLPPTERTCPVWVPLVALRSVPPGATTTDPPAVSMRAVALSNWSTPEEPWPTVRLKQLALPSIVTVVPSAMVTSSEEVGIRRPGHGASGTVEIQPPLPLVVIIPGVLVARLPDSGALNAPSVRAYMVQ